MNGRMVVAGAMGGMWVGVISNRRGPRDLPSNTVHGALLTVSQTVLARGFDFRRGP